MDEKLDSPEVKEWLKRVIEINNNLHQYVSAKL